MTSKTGNKGFLLIEVVVALAIISIGMAGILRAFIVSLNAMDASQRYIVGISLAKEKTAEYLQSAMEHKGLAPGSFTGVFQKPYDQYKWEANIAPSDIKDSNVMTISVSNNEPNSSNQVNLVNYVPNYVPNKI